jgi:transglutaminase-like putative cysteine protease
VEASVESHPRTWADVESDAVADRFVEYLQPTAYTPHAGQIVEVSRSLRARSDPREAPLLVGRWVREAMRYEPGTTEVHTSAVEALEAGSGVCQDFAHLAIPALRCAGIPARYVSGYLHPKSEAVLGETVSGESHAWIEAWNGDAWAAYDPTNGRDVARDHVLIATGRDYADVAPVKGVIAGGGSSRLDATVEITRLA